MSSDHSSLKLFDINFKGATGNLEGKYFHNPAATSTALILSPHPLHGGTMNNKVVYNMFHRFRDFGVSVLRFNYRGIGESQGTKFDGGECVDAAMALDWLQENNPEVQTIWVCGFSFGAYIAMQLSMRRPEVHEFIAAAPMLADFSFFSPCPVPGLIVQGTADQVVSEEEVYAMYQSLQQKDKLTYTVIEGADHFFSTKMDEFNIVVSSYIRLKLSSNPNNIKRNRRDRRRRTIIA
jgi:alpha/beta superfamily hydrolase